MKNMVILVTHVLKQPAYALLTLIAALLMVVISTYMLNLPLIWSTLTAKWTLTAKASLFLKLLGGVITNNTTSTLLLLVVTSVLAGTNLAVAIYQWKKQRTVALAQHSASATGVGIGVLAAGCSNCGLSILAMLGLAGAITFLPFKGLELSILSIIILTATLFWLTKAPTKCITMVKKKLKR